MKSYSIILDYVIFIFDKTKYSNVEKYHLEFITKKLFLPFLGNKGYLGNFREPNTPQIMHQWASYVKINCPVTSRT